MNRVINDPDLVVEDMLAGILLAHPELVQYESNPRVIRKRNTSPKGQVGIVTGGGSGHEPAFLGYVGPGLVDAVDGGLAQDVHPVAPGHEVFAGKRHHQAQQDKHQRQAEAVEGQAQAVARRGGDGGGKDFTVHEARLNKASWERAVSVLTVTRRPPLNTAIRSLKCSSSGASDDTTMAAPPARTNSSSR